MTETAAALNANVLEQVLIGGDLSKLTTAERLSYYLAVCESQGLNPLTRPFEYITLNGKLTLYARRDCSEQLRKIRGVSVSNMRTTLLPDETYIVTADFHDKDGRTDQATGVVSLKGLTGDPRCNRMMGAETKCKRRGTLSISGMGMLDETEVETIVDPTAAAAKKFPKLKPLAPPAETRTMAELAAPEPEREVFVLGTPDPSMVPISQQEVNALYGALREFTAALGYDFDTKRTELRNKMGLELGCEHFHDLTPDQLAIVMGWIRAAWDVAERKGKS